MSEPGTEAGTDKSRAESTSRTGLWGVVGTSFWLLSSGNEWSALPEDKSIG